MNALGGHICPVTQRNQVCRFICDADAIGVVHRNNPRYIKAATPSNIHQEISHEIEQLRMAVGPPYIYQRWGGATFRRHFLGAFSPLFTILEALKAVCAHFDYLSIRGTLRWEAYSSPWFLRRLVCFYVAF